MNNCVKLFADLLPFTYPIIRRNSPNIRVCNKFGKCIFYVFMVLVAGSPFTHSKPIIQVRSQSSLAKQVGTAKRAVYQITQSNYTICPKEEA